MSKTTFFLLAAVGFSVATLAIGIRGLENWQPHEYTFYYAMLGWAAHDVYKRHVQAAAA